MEHTRTLDNSKYRSNFHKSKLSRFWNQTADKVVDTNKALKINFTKQRTLGTRNIIIRYQENEEEIRLVDFWKRISSKRNKEKGLFAANVEIPDIRKFQETYDKLQPFYRTNSDYDLLKFMLIEVAGINKEQFFLKGNGSWTGLSMSDCGFGTFDVNLGPGETRWIFIPFGEYKKLNEVLKKQVKELEKDSLFECWGLIHVTEKFLDENNIKYESTIQQPGEYIYISGSCIQQTYNKGYGMNVSWNLAVFHSETIENMINYYNKTRIVFKKEPSFSIPRLLHMLLIHHFVKLTSNEVKIIANFLKIIIIKERNAHSKLIENLEIEKIKFDQCHFFKIDINICLNCDKNLYLYAYCFIDNPDNKKSFCAVCFYENISDENPTFFQHKNLLSFEQFIDDIMDNKRNKEPNHAEKRDWTYNDKYLASKLFRLQFEQTVSGVVEILTRNTKGYKAKLMIEENNRKIKRLRKINKRVKNDEEKKRNSKKIQKLKGSNKGLQRCIEKNK